MSSSFILKIWSPFSYPLLHRNENSLYHIICSLCFLNSVMSIFKYTKKLFINKLNPNNFPLFVLPEILSFLTKHIFLLQWVIIKSIWLIRVIYVLSEHCSLSSFLLLIISMALFFSSVFVKDCMWFFSLTIHCVKKSCILLYGEKFGGLKAEKKWPCFCQSGNGITKRNTRFCS